MICHSCCILRVPPSVGDGTWKFAAEGRILPSVWLPTAPHLSSKDKMGNHAYYHDEKKKTEQDKHNRGMKIRPILASKKIHAARKSMMHAKIENTMTNVFKMVAPSMRSNDAPAHKIDGIQRESVLIKVRSLSSLALS